eukprot:6329780-Prymnesium_polylepis.1
MLLRLRSATLSDVDARITSAIAPAPPAPRARSLRRSSRAARRPWRSDSVASKIRPSPSGQHETLCLAAIASRIESESELSSTNTPGSCVRSGSSCVLRTRLAKPSTS